MLGVFVFADRKQVDVGERITVVDFSGAFGDFYGSSRFGGRLVFFFFNLGFAALAQRPGGRGFVFFARNEAAYFFAAAEQSGQTTSNNQKDFFEEFVPARRCDAAGKVKGHKGYDKHQDGQNDATAGEVVYTGRGGQKLTGKKHAQTAAALETVYDAETKVNENGQADRTEQESENPAVGADKCFVTHNLPAPDQRCGQKQRQCQTKPADNPAGGIGAKTAEPVVQSV